MPKVCRTCLKEITSLDFISIDSTVTSSLNSVVVKQELAICIPELDLNLVANPIVCNPCVNDLHAAYDFKRKCLQTEERINTYVQTNTLETTCIDLSHIIRNHNENIPKTVNVKLEPDPATEKELDDDLNNYGSNMEFESNMECVIKTDPTQSSENYTEEASYSDFSFSNETASEYLPELSIQEIDKKSVTTSKRRTFTIEDKMDIIKMIENGTKMAEVCRKTGLATSTVCCIMKKKDIIVSAFAKNGLNQKRLRKPRHADVDEALLSWCKEQQSMSVALSGPILRVKAEELARTIGNYEFVCTNGWLERFRIRYNICVGKKNREVKLD